MKDSVKFSRSPVDCIWRGLHCNMTRATTRNVSALTEMRSGARSIGSRKPLSAGPTIPERLSCTPPSVIAEGSSSLLTTSGTIAPQTGAPNASPNPKHEDASKHRIRVDHLCPRSKSKECCACSLPNCSTHDHNAPVHDVSESAGWQREEEQWHGGSGCHEGERKRRGTDIMHQPRRRQVLA